jgi:hypothetical protein
MPTIRSTVVALFLVLSPALVWPQVAIPDKPSSPALDQQTQQSGNTGDSATQSGAATRSDPQTAAPTPAQDLTPAVQKAVSTEGQQTKRMFGVVPNLAAVSADTQLPPLTARGNSYSPRRIVWTIRHSFGRECSLAKVWL